MSFKIRFKVRSKKRGSKSEMHYIYCRLRVDGTPAPDFGTGIGCKFSDWDYQTQRIRGKSELVRQQNLKLDQIRADLETIYNELRKSDKPITAQIIKQLYTQKTPAPKVACLLAYYTQYLSELQNVIDQTTLRTWLSRKNTLDGYVQFLNRKDVELVEVTPKWVKGYYNYHLEKLQNSKTHAARAVQALKRVLDFAVENEALPYNATRSLKVARDKPKPIQYLRAEELEKLANCPFYDNRLQRVVDCFMFQCYTGMAYNELLIFDAQKHISTDKQGIAWIKIYRGKTKELCLIPLMRQARAMLEKYDYQLPIITNQKMNLFIKEAAKVADLPNYEDITTHLGRKTAGTILLNKGIDIKIVSKILGHKSVLVTERHYAELLTEAIAANLIKNGLL